MAVIKIKSKFQSTVISIRQLAKLAGINYFSLYMRKKGEYKSELSADVKTKIANALVKDITPFLNDLGFDVDITRTN